MIQNYIKCQKNKKQSFSKNDRAVCSQEDVTAMPATRLKIFISSVQEEFKQLRLDLKAFLLGDAFLHRFVSDVFLFEDLPAKDRRADKVYLEEVERCDIYLGIFGYDYGSQDQDGISPRNTSITTLPSITKLVSYMSGALMKRSVRPGCGSWSAKPATN